MRTLTIIAVCGGRDPLHRPEAERQEGWSLGTWDSYQRQPPGTYILGGGSDSPKFPQLPQSSSPKEDQVLNTQACWCISESNSVQVLVTLEERVTVVSIKVIGKRSQRRRGGGVPESEASGNQPDMWTIL